MAIWFYEGIACYVSTTPLSGHVPLYKAWNGSDHFYTSNKNEYDGLSTKWSRNGIACYVASSPSIDHVALHRFYHRKKDDHLYTADEYEKSQLEQHRVWRYEGIQCYVRKAPGADHQPLYRAYNDKIVDHFYTTNWAEIQAVSPPVPSMMTRFDPVQHGFKFGNYFTISPTVFGQGGPTWDMGLCGGMCAAALSRFNKNTPVEMIQEPPQQGTPLYSELLTRQIMTLVPYVVGLIATYQARPDVGHWWRGESVGHLTIKEWPKLRQLLDQGKPTIIVLIKVESLLPIDIDKNHQVLAIGYGYDDARKYVTIYVYDPNEPKRTQEFCFSVKSNNIQARYSTFTRVRGFFVNPEGEFASQ